MWMGSIQCSYNFRNKWKNFIYSDIIEGTTYRLESDEQTGYKESVIIDSRSKTLSPAISVSEKKDSRTVQYPVGAHVIISEGEKVKAGTIIAKMPRSANTSGDITGGLPRVTEMLEARNCQILQLFQKLME